MLITMRALNLVFLALLLSHCKARDSSPTRPANIFAKRDATNVALLIGSPGTEPSRPGFLPGVRRDLDTITKALESTPEFNAQPIPVYDPDRRDLEAAIDAAAKILKDKKDASLLLYYAGHGAAVEDGYLPALRGVEPPRVMRVFAMGDALGSRFVRFDSLHRDLKDSSRWFGDFHASNLDRPASIFRVPASGAGLEAFVAVEERSAFFNFKLCDQKGNCEFAGDRTSGVYFNNDTPTLTKFSNFAALTALQPELSCDGPSYWSRSVDCNRSRAFLILSEDQAE